MSGWDWLHAGLEVATYAQVQRAQRNLNEVKAELAEMRTAAQIESARRALVEAMKKFVFDISRDIQLAEEQLSTYPQQVYIVSSALNWRFAHSGLSEDVFPDFQDKEYVFKTKRKITDVIEKSRSKLTQEQINQSTAAIQYVVELPLLQDAISAKSAQESLRATERRWHVLTNRQKSKKTFVALGIATGIFTMCVGFPMFNSGLSAFKSGETLNGLFLMIIGGGLFPAGTLGLFVLSGKIIPEYAPLQVKRERWQKKLMPRENWQQVVSTFGDLSSKQYKRIYDERVDFLNPIFGGEFQKNSISGE